MAPLPAWPPANGSIYAGTQHGLTFATQINKVETLRSELTFGTAAARPAGLRLQGARRQGAGTGDRHAGLMLMPALETVGQYIEESCCLLQDEFTPYRYPHDDLIDALNIGLQEARRLRADLFLPLFELALVRPDQGDGAGPE